MLQVAKDDGLVRSATGKLVKRGAISDDDRHPEISYSEIEWGEKIGGGCFGNVYRGRCRGAQVAIKKLLKQDLDPKMMEEFRKEVDIMTQMRHPNVVLFMGACTEPGRMCIVSEILEDSVYNIIQQRKEEVPLLKRLKMARDAAAGLAWLHGATPQIVHRDVKPQNLLVDVNWNVKVCDFGLSQVKLSNTTIRDGKSIPGTPLYMAPEVLAGKDVDEKSDIYAFGIVLWEIITGKDPFPEHNEYKAFKEAIIEKGERPEIPAETHPKLRALMEKCWQKDASQRPQFTEILKIIDELLVDVSIDDPVGQAFWKQHFLGKDHVPWGEFLTHFLNLLKLPPANSKDLNLLCLKKILADENRDPKAKDPFIVNAEKFGHLLNWFGPLIVDHKGFSILDKMRTIMQKEWFFGYISKDTAEDLLASQPKGSYLIRTSKTEKDSPFTISKVSKKGKINHQRIHKKSDGTFEINIKMNDKNKTLTSKDDMLVPFIRQVAGELYLEEACPGSMFRPIFNPSKIEGYLPEND